MWARGVWYSYERKSKLSSIRFGIPRSSRYNLLNVDNSIAQVQVSLNIKKEGSYLVIIKVLTRFLSCIKNPVDASDPETAGRVWKGLSASARAHYDKELQRNFRDRRSLLLY